MVQVGRKNSGIPALAHAHIMLTVRPLAENGTWQYKTQKEYLCIRDGKEMGFTADEFKAAQLDGWEKQYQYRVGKKKVYMAPSVAQEQGLERVSKTPKITKAIMDTIPAIARGLESLRQKMVMYRYQIIHFRSAKWQAADELRKVKPDLKRFDELVAEIKTKTQEHKALTAEKKQTPLWSLLKRNDLTRRIAQLTEELEELRSEKAQLLARFEYTEDKEMKQAKDWAKLKEKSIDDLSAKENHCEQELHAALTEFQTLSRKAETHDSDTLWPERLNLRKTMSKDTEDQLKSHFGSSFSHRRLQSAESDIRLNLEMDESDLRDYLKRMHQQEQQKAQQKFRDRNMER